jgi:hypothetical protein
MEVADWVWGVLEGGFNEKQTTSQIIVDAAITLIPVVGDVAVVRDLLACVLRMVNDPAKRSSKLEWLQLTLLLFALIPVAGGVIKGVGRLVLKEGTASAKLIGELVEFLNHVGIGNAVKWLKELNLPQYTETLVRKFEGLVTRLESVFQKLKSKMPLLTEAMRKRLDQVATVLGELKVRGKTMIPEAVRDIWNRLEKLQQSIYEGKWHPAPVGTKTATRTMERRLVKSASGQTVYEMSKIDYPGLKSIAQLPEAKGWPALRSTTRMKPADLAGACHSIPKPVWVPEGTELVRIMQSPKGSGGVWWMFKKDVPKDGTAWREDFAVLEEWSNNGLKIEVKAPKGGAYLWVSTVSSQIQTSATAKAAGQYLRGGATQVFLDLDYVANKEVQNAVNAATPVPTNWGPAELQNIGVPPLSAGVTTDEITGVVPKPGVIEQLPAGSKVGATVARSGSQEANP